MPLEIYTPEQLCCQALRLYGSGQIFVYFLKLCILSNLELAAPGHPNGGEEGSQRLDASKAF